MSKFSSCLALACALAYLLAGVFFFFDPSHSTTPGSADYWQALAQGHWGRSAFLAAFACSGLFALGVIQPLTQLLKMKSGSVLHWASCLAYVGYAVNTVSYVRLFAAEPLRAQAYLTGDAATQQAIASFSLVLDPDGWLSFGAVGFFIAVCNIAAIQRRAWFWPLAWLGIAVALAYWTALAGLIIDHSRLVALAAGIGAIGLGPIWWSGIAVVLWRRSV